MTWSEKRSHFSRRSTFLLFTSFSKILVSTERRLIGWQFLAVEVFLIYLHIRITDETFHQSGKQDSLAHFEEWKKKVWKFRLTVLENHHWNTIRTKQLGRIKVGYDLFHQLGSYRNSTHFGLVLDGQTRKDMPESPRLEFLKKFLIIKSALIPIWLTHQSHYIEKV